MTPMMEIGDLHVAYGQVEAVRGVSLQLQPGQIISVIGPNGAGKTTLLGAAMGLMPSRGVLRFEGEDLHGLDVEARVERGLCLVPEKRELFGELSVLDNLQLGAYSKRLRADALKRRLQAVYDRFPRLGDRRTQLAGTMSGGEQQMLAMSRALSTDPAVLLLDELSMGLAPIIVGRLYEVVAQVAQTGVSVLVVEQFARTVLGIADRAAIMLHGRISRIGAPDELAEELSSAYLGGSGKGSA